MNKKNQSNNTLKKSSVFKSLRFFFIKLICVILVLFITFNVFFGIFRVNGNNMYPSLRDGDLVITYRLGTYAIGDVVAYNYNAATNFGRIDGLAGDMIEITDGVVMLNDSVLNEKVVYSTTPGEMSGPLYVGIGETFLLNDYRNDTDDSRSFGTILMDKLRGKVIFVLRIRGF